MKNLILSHIIIYNIDSQEQFVHLISNTNNDNKESLTPFTPGKVSLREASDLLGLTLSETIDLFLDMGVKGNIHAEDVMKSLESLRHLNS